MPDLNLLMKPASGNCNMRCHYCFYADEMNKRNSSLNTFMSMETADNSIKKSLEYVGSGTCTFGFQGGEPTLRGLDFYKSFINIVNRYNTGSAKIHYCIQTNGLLIDEEWVSFLKENKFLVGLSLDGNSVVHNANRVDAAGNGTFNRVMKTARMLEKENVEFNILTVVTAKTAKSVDSIYNFFIKNNLLYQQYIPCLDPIFEKRGSRPYSLTPDLFGDFLIKLFDRWYKDRKNGKFIYIHYFESLAGMILGYPPASCGMAGTCSIQNVIEADGTVYPCDFYCLDDYRIGNINTDSFEVFNRYRIPFIQQSYAGLEKCVDCKYGKICHGGCRRDRQTRQGIEGNYFCESYKRFFDYALPKMVSLLH